MARIEMARIFCCTFVFFAVAGSALAVDETEIDAVFHDLNRTDSPGCSVAVFHQDRLVFAEGYGMASLELGVPNSPQTVFYIGSTSKQFVAASIVLAAQRGDLSFDDDIRQYLPEIPDYGEPITIRHLIHHTSGLRDYLSLMYLAGHPFENVFTNEWTVDLIARQKALNFAPGEDNLYSNSGYFLLSQIVERATGKSLREFADENIFRPLGMVHTHFHDDRRHVVENRAMAYAPADDGGFELEWYSNFDKVGSGGLLTTVEDLLLWDRIFYGAQFQGDAFIEQMLERGRLDDGEILDYAFALSHGEYGGLPTVDHGGAFMGFRAQLLRFPAQHLSVATLCNLATANPSRRSQEVAALFLADQLETAQAETGADPADVEAREIARTEIDHIAGHYWSEEEQFSREIRLEDDKLMYVRSTESANELVGIGNGAYRMLDVPVNLLVRFEPSDAPKASRMVVTVADDDPAIMERYVPWEPTSEQLRTYAGTYFNEDLDVEYQLTPAEGRLTVSRGAAESVEVEPKFQDLFSSDDLGTLRFELDGSGRALGFVLDAGRVRGLKFTRN